MNCIKVAIFREILYFRDLKENLIERKEGFKMKVKLIAGKTEEFEKVVNKWLEEETPQVKSVGLTVNPSGIWLTGLFFYEEKGQPGEPSVLNE
jgi:hypothetical protein